MKREIKPKGALDSFLTERRTCRSILTELSLSLLPLPLLRTGVTRAALGLSDFREVGGGRGGGRGGRGEWGEGKPRVATTMMAAVETLSDRRDRS